MYRVSEDILHSIFKKLSKNHEYYIEQQSAKSLYFSPITRDQYGFTHILFKYLTIECCKLKCNNKIKLWWLLLHYKLTKSN